MIETPKPHAYVGGKFILPPPCHVCGQPASHPVHVQERATCEQCGVAFRPYSGTAKEYHCALPEGHGGGHSPYPVPMGQAVREPSGRDLSVDRVEELERAARRFLDAWGFDHEVGTPREQSDAADALDAALQAPAPSVTLTAEPKRRSGCACRGPWPCLHEEHEIRTFLAPAVTLTAGARIPKEEPVDKELKAAAEAWLRASHDYYEAMKKRGLAGGCVWLTAQDGAMAIFTRGEYRQQLLHNIETETDAERAYQFGVAEFQEADYAE